MGKTWKEKTPPARSSGGGVIAEQNEPFIP